MLRFATNLRVCNTRWLVNLVRRVRPKPMGSFIKLSNSRLGCGHMWSSFECWCRSACCWYRSFSCSERLEVQLQPEPEVTSSAPLRYICDRRYHGYELDG